MMDVFDRDKDDLLSPENQEGRLTFSIKERMAVSATNGPAIEMMVNAVLSKGYRITGGTLEQRAFFEEMFDELEMDRVTREELTAFWVGFAVEVKDIAQRKDGKYYFRRLIPLPPETIQFQMSHSGEVEAVIQDARYIGVNKVTKFFPGMFNLFTYDGGISLTFGDPRGMSVFERIYEDYWEEEHIRRMKDQFLELGAGGLLVGNCGELGYGTLYGKVEKLRSGSAVVIFGGQTITFAQPDGDGSNYMDNLAFHKKNQREGLLVSMFFGQEGSISAGALTPSAFELLARTRVQQFQNWVSNIRNADIRQLTLPNWGPPGKEGFCKYEFLVATEQELEIRASRDMRLVKMGALGRNDIDDIRIHNEWKPGDPGEPLILPTQAASAPSKDGTVGDSIAQGLEDNNSDGEQSDERKDAGVEER